MGSSTFRDGEGRPRLMNLHKNIATQRSWYGEKLLTQRELAPIPCSLQESEDLPQSDELT